MEHDFFFKGDSTIYLGHHQQCRALLPGLSDGPQGGLLQEKEFRDVERKINPPSQEGEILLSQFPHGLISFRKDDREGTTKVLGMRALTNMC